MSAYSDLVLLDRPIVYWPLTDAGPTYADVGPSDITLQAVGTVTPHAYAGPLAGEHSAGFGGSPSQFLPYSYTGYLVGNGSPDPGFHDSSGNVVSASIPYVNLRGPLSIEGWLYPLGDPAWNPVQNSSDGWFGWGDPDGGPGGGFGSGISATMGFSNDPWYPGGYINAPFLYSYQYNTWSSPNGRRVSSVFTALDYRTTWMHLVLTVDRTGQGAIYINGVQQTLTGNQPWVFTFPPGNSLSTYPYQETAWFTLGSLCLPGTTWPSSGGVVPPSTGDNRQWNGGLAHVAMYNYALSACQVSSHYVTAMGTSAAPGTYNSHVLADNPVAYWPLDEGGSAVVDATGHGYSGLGSTLGDGTFTAGTVPFVGSGQSTLFHATTGGAWLNFAGTLGGWPSSALPHHGAPFTYEYWARTTDALGNGPRLWVEGAGALEYSALQGPYFGSPQQAVDLFANESATSGFEQCRTPVDWTQWQYVVGLWTGTSWQIYINGAAIAPESSTGTVGAGFTATHARLGYDYRLGFELAHAAVYDYALTPCQVRDRYLLATTGTSTGCKSYNDLVLCDDPEVYWPLDGSGSTPYVDLGSNHNDLHEQQLSVNTPPPPALTQNGTGPISGQGSLTFNGTTWLENSALTGVFYDVDTTGVYQDRGGQNVFTSMTFECWFKLPTPTSWNNFPCIELFQNSFTNSTFEFFPSTGPGYAANQGQLVLGNAFSLVASQTTTITPLAWHHFVITYDWSGSLHFVPGPFQWQYPDFYTTGTACYLDGVLIPQPTGLGGWFTDRWNNPETWPGDAFFDWWSRADVVRLGAFYGDGYGYPYPAYNPHPDRASGMSLAGVALYNYALSACQVLAHYQKATTGSYTPCSPCCMSAAQAALLRRLFRQIQIPW